MIIRGKAGTSKITGTLKLYDETANEIKQLWNVSKNGSVCSESYTASVLSGHKYTLSFTGTVYGRDNVYEPIAKSVTKTN